MASSQQYWKLASDVGDRLEAFTEEARATYTKLESDDDPGGMSRQLETLRLGLQDLVEVLAAAVPALADVDTSLSMVPTLNDSPLKAK